MKRNFILLFVFLIILTILNLTSIEAKPKYKITNDFKNTKYEDLNNIINTYLNKTINSFKKSNCDDLDYYMYITNNTYEYKNYISYVFYIESYSGGAHPNHNIWTIIYDKNNHCIVTIDTLLQYDPNILNKLSKISRNNLLYNENIVDTNMMLEGTKPTKDNFSKFVFSNEGIILFFEHYQVAPYSSGEFKVVVPYNYIKG